MLAKADYDGEKEFDADCFENAYKQQNSHALLFKFSNELVIKNMENLKKLDGKIENIGDFQRLHYIQCVIYGVMYNALGEKPWVRAQIWKNVKKFLDDFQKDQLPDDYKECDSEEDFINMVTEKLYSGTDLSRGTKKIRTFISTAYNITKEPMSPFHVTQINTLLIGNKNKFLCIDCAYLYFDVPLDYLIENMGNLIPEKSVIGYGVRAGLSYLVPALEILEAVLLFGFENNITQKIFDFAISTLTLPVFGILAAIFAAGGTTLGIFFTCKAVSNSKFNRSIAENKGKLELFQNELVNFTDADLGINQNADAEDFLL